MGALTSLNLASNSLVSKSEWIKKADVKVGEILDGNPVVEVHSSATHIKVLQISGMKAVANAIRDMEAISSVNLLLNGIGVDQAQNLVSILREHPTLKTLCGTKGDDTELDMRGKMHGAGDAVMLIPDIIDNGALSVLNLAENSIGGYYTMKGHHDQQFHPTPEGKHPFFVCISDPVIFPCRAYCHCQCHQRYGGVDVAEYQRQ
jgi:hypothetical protein